MVEVLQPHTYLPISRVLGAPSDPGPYYVQAVIRKSFNNSIIATVNMLVQGNQIYSTNWLIPNDSSGNGTFITITTTVYTDAGYSVISQNYEIEQDTFLIYDRGGYVQSLATQISALIQSEGVDYKKIKKIIDAGIDKAVKTYMTEDEKQDKEELKPVIDIVGRISSSLDDFRKAFEAYCNEDEEEEKPFDYAPITAALDAAKTSLVSAVADLKHYISQIEYPEHKETNLSPVIEAIKQLDSEGIVQDIQEASEKISTTNEVADKVLGIVKDIESKAKDFIYAMSTKGSKPEETAPPKPKMQLNRFGKLTPRSTP